MAGLLLLSSALRRAIGTAFTCTFTLLNNSVDREGRGRMQVPAAHGDDAHTLHMHAHIYIGMDIFCAGCRHDDRCGGEGGRADARR